MAEQEQTGVPINGAPMQEITGKGYTIKVPKPYSEGHELRENEAEAMNQVYAENIRNNITTRIKRMIDNGDTVDQETVDQMVQEYVQTYDFGTRASAGPRLSAEEKKARSLAKDAVKKKIRDAEDQDLKDFTNERLDELALEALEKNPHIRDKAKEILAAQQEVTSGLEV